MAGASPSLLLAVAPPPARGNARRRDRGGAGRRHPAVDAGQARRRGEPLLREGAGRHAGRGGQDRAGGRRRRRRPRHQGGARERRRQVARVARLPDRERRDLDAGRHRSGQHRDRAAGVRGPGRAVLVKAKDAPDRGPPAPPGKKKGAPAPTPPFSVKLLVDEATMRAQKAALTQLTIGPANRIAMHKHPGAEVLYVLKGHARVLGPTGIAPEKLDEGHGDPDPGRHAARDREHGPHVLRGDAAGVRADGPRARLPRSEGRRGARGVRGDPRRRAGGRPAGAKSPSRRRAGRRDAAGLRGQGEDQAAARPGEDRQPARCTSASWRRTRAPRCRATATLVRRRSCTCCRARAT